MRKMFKMLNKKEIDIFLSDNFFFYRNFPPLISCVVPNL